MFFKKALLSPIILSFSNPSYQLNTVISTCKQVDNAAIAIMSDKELKDMGISAVGDRVKL